MITIENAPMNEYTIFGSEIMVSQRSSKLGLIATGNFPLAIAKDIFTDSPLLSLMASQILSKSRGE